MVSIRDLKATWRDCPSYSPCRIDNKCMAYDPSIMACSTCEAGAWKPCKHKESERNFIIRRENFKLNVDDNIKNRIKELEREVNERR